jgi:hypothetical protein
VPEQGALLALSTCAATGSPGRLPDRKTLSVCSYCCSGPVCALLCNAQSPHKRECSCWYPRVPHQRAGSTASRLSIWLSVSPQPQREEAGRTKETGKGTHVQPQHARFESVRCGLQRPARRAARPKERSWTHMQHRAGLPPCGSRISSLCLPVVPVRVSGVNLSVRDCCCLLQLVAESQPLTNGWREQRRRGAGPGQAGGSDR